MTSEMGEMFNDLRQIRQENRAHNREDSAKYLTDNGIRFASKNGGAHLIVEADSPIDFWPGTGLWNNRKGRKGRGVAYLVKFIKGTA